MKLRLLLTPLFAFVLMLVNPALVYSETTPQTNETNPVQIDKLTGKELHLKLVEVAYRYDFYNKRCRGISISREVNEVNRLFLRKYGITINNFIKLNIDRDARGYQDTVKQSLYQSIFEMGGCESDQNDPFLKQMQSDYRILLENAQTSPWFPRT